MRVRSRSRSTRPSPPLGGVACAPRVVPALGAGRAVPRGPCPSACPAPVPCSVWRAWGGAVRSRFPPTWLGVVGVAAGRPRGGAYYRCEGRLGSCAPPPPTARPLGGLSGSTIHVLWARACGCGGPALSPRPARPVGAARRGVGPWRSCAGGRAGGGGACAVPPGCAAGGGPVGRRVALPHSVSLPSLGRQQSGCHWRCAVHGGRGPPYHSGSCSPGFSGYDLRGVLARRRGLACSSRPPWGPAAGAGGRVALRLLSQAGGGPSPLPRGVGAGSPAACGPVGGRGAGVSRRDLPAPLLGGGLRYSILAPFVSPARSLPACACCRGRSGAPRWGGVRGGPWTTLPGALADLNPPSALPEWAVVTGGSCGARPPYCSVVRVAPARQCGLAGAGPAAAPPTASPSLLGGGAPPPAPGGRRAAPVAPQLGGVRGGGVGGRPPRPLSGLSGRGGGSGGGPLVPWRRLLTAGGGGRHGSTGPGGQPSAGGSRPSPAPLYLELEPRARPRWGPSSLRPLSRGAGRPGAAVKVSGQWLAGCRAAGPPPRSLSPPSLPREVARSHASCRTVGGAWVGGPSSPPHSLASAVWAITCAATCVGAGAVAAAGCAGGSASGRGRCAKPGGASCWRPHP